MEFLIDGVCFENESVFTDSTISSGSIVIGFGILVMEVMMSPVVSHLFQETDLFNISLYVQSEQLVKFSN